MALGGIRVVVIALSMLMLGAFLGVLCQKVASTYRNIANARQAMRQRHEAIKKIVVKYQFYLMVRKIVGMSK